MNVIKSDQGFHILDIDIESFDYLTLSERTASGKFYGELVDANQLASELATFVLFANKLDRYKKLLFYGEDKNKGRKGDNFYLENDENPYDGFSILKQLDHSKSEQILHALLGVMTEAGELAEALIKAIKKGDLDTTNLLEESGDIKWYLAMLARALGNAWDADERRNIEKLKARFPDKFTSEAANERDLKRERTVLEKADKMLKAD